MAIDREKVLQSAQKYVEKRKYDKAVQEYQKLIDADPNDARTLLKVGDLQAKQGAYGDAVTTYERVGKLYSHQGFALKAIAVYKQIREIIQKQVPHLEDQYAHIPPKLAELYQQLGLTSDALAALDEVATRLQRQQRDQEALDVFRRIVELDPTNPLPHLRLAEALSRVRDVDGAVEEFKVAASQLAGIGRRDDALKVLERLLHHKPDPEQARVAAELYLTRGHPSDGMQALAKLQICFQANPRDLDTLGLLARAFNAIGQGAKAIEVQKEMGRVARDTGRPDVFREISERLLRIAPQDEVVRRLATQAGILQAPPDAAFGQSGPYGAAAVAAPPPPPPPVPQSQPRPPYGQPMVAQSLPPEEAEIEEIYEEEAEYEAVEAEEIVGEEAEEYAQYETEGYAEQAGDGYGDPAYAQQGGDAGYGQEQAYGQEGSAYGQQAAYAEEGAYEEGAYEDGQAYAEGGAYADQGYGAEAQPYGAQGGYEQAEYAYDGGEVGAAEELGEAPGDVTAQIEKVIQDANAFRRVRLYAKALETLRIGLELEPRSMDLHEVCRDVLLEAGQTEDAVQEMLVIASLFVDALDGESAARALQDVLAFDPQNARAIELLQELGYEIVDEGEEVVEGGYVEEAFDDSGAQERLPSYDLEEMGPADVAAHYSESPQVYVRGTPSEGVEAAAEGESPLPSFPLEPAAPAPYLGGATDRPPAVAAAAGMELEDALEEAEFFATRGLFDDARAILEEQQARHPKNPLVRERMAELDALEESKKGSGAREKPQQDRAFDIAASLDALEGGDSPRPSQPGFGAAGEQVDVEEVFAKFKEGVAKQISVDDSDSHYNLGIAYKEMMLLDDAIREFELAAMDPKRECVCRSMIGMIHIERGNINEGIEAFLLGLNAPIKDPAQETVLCYEIGAAYEAKKLSKEALSYYQKAMRRDPNYRDVQERVRRLARATEQKPTTMKAAVGADDEFDRAFDDLLK